MLENTPIAIRALGRMLDEVLTNRCKILFIKACFSLELIFSMRKSTPLLFILVFAHLALQPVFTKFCFYFLLPRTLVGFRRGDLFAFIVLTDNLLVEVLIWIWFGVLVKLLLWCLRFDRVHRVSRVVLLLFVSLDLVEILEILAKLSNWLELTI